MWSPNMCKYDLLNKKYLSLQQERKELISRMWDVWREMGENERAHFLEQHDVECNCDAPPSEK